MNQTRRHALLIDLDGTLANCDHRREFVQKKDWKGFYERMAMDKLNTWCRYLIVNRPKFMDVVLVSGRPEEYRETTICWLDNYSVDYHALFMRPAGDYRKDCIVKEEILDRDILPRWIPFLAIDDRKQVVDMWRRRGIVTLHCAEGDF